VEYIFRGEPAQKIAIIFMVDGNITTIGEPSGGLTLEMGTISKSGWGLIGVGVEIVSGK